MYTLCYNYAHSGRQILSASWLVGCDVDGVDGFPWLLYQPFEAREYSSFPGFTEEAKEGALIWAVKPGKESRLYISRVLHPSTCTPMSVANNSHME